MGSQFFYINDDIINKWQIEDRFIRLLVKSPKEIGSILIDEKKLNYRLFYCNEPLNKIKNTNAYKYIKDSEIRLKIKDNKTLRNKKQWYSIGQIHFGKLLMKKGYGDIFYTNLALELAVDQTFYILDYNLNKDYLWIYFNSSIWFLLLNLSSSQGLGDGLLRPTTNEIKLANVFEFNGRYKIEVPQRSIKSIFTELGIDRNRKIREQSPNPLRDRKLIDEIVFNELGMSKKDRNEVYWSLCELVKARLDKAKSK